MNCMLEQCLSCISRQDRYIIRHCLKKDTTMKIDVNNLSACSSKGLLWLFLDKSDDFANKNEEFCNSNIMKMLKTINGIPHQLFSAPLLAREIYPQIKEYFYKENFNVTWEEFSMTLMRIFTWGKKNLNKNCFKVYRQKMI